MDSLRGQFLLASPRLLDPNFRRSVVLMLEHGEEGALGVIVNRPTEVAVATVVPDLSDVAEPRDLLFAGGPVQRNAVLFLHRPLEPDAPQLIPGVCIGQSASLLVELAGATPASGPHPLFRVYHGYAGWSAGQLEGELALDSWLVAPATAELVFSELPGQLWRRCMRELGPHHALLAEEPEDPSLN